MEGLANTSVRVTTEKKKTGPGEEDGGGENSSNRGEAWRHYRGKKVKEGGCAW